MNIRKIMLHYKPSFLCILLLLWSTCANAQKPKDDLKPEEIYKNALPSIMTLKVEKKSGDATIGTAFIAIKDNIAVTAWHVVKNAKSVKAKFSEGEEFDVSGLIDKDEKRDIALIRVKVSGKPMLSLLKDDPEVGSRLYTIGAPKGLEFSISDGLLSQIQKIDGLKQYQFTCPASPGDSGCPLLNAKGEAIGVVSWQFREGQNLNFASPSSYVIALDSSLPTTPWDMVKISEPESTTAHLLSNEAMDKVLADAVCGYDDVETLRTYFVQEVLLKRNGFREGVHPIVYMIQRNLLAGREVLEQSTTIQKSRANLRTELLKAITLNNEALDLLIRGIRRASLDEDWSPASKDLISNSMGTFRNILLEPIRDALKEMLPFKSFIDALPLDLADMLTNGPPQLKFGVATLTRIKPLGFLAVTKNSLADKLGFKPGDIVTMAGGTQLNTLRDLKIVVVGNKGSKLRFTIIRGNKTRTIDAKIPADVDFATKP